MCYEITCLLCLRDGREGKMSTSYYGESGKNMHCRSREHISKFNSKSTKLQNESAFLKHLESSHGGRDKAKSFSEYFDITILKAYRKPFTKCVEEGTFISNHNGELLNSKSEWHQAKIIRTTTTVVQGGADIARLGVLQQVRGQGAGGEGQGGGQQARGQVAGLGGQGGEQQARGQAAGHGGQGGGQGGVQGGVQGAGVQQPQDQIRRRSPRGH